MPSTPLEIQAASGQTLTIRLYPDDGTDVLANGTSTTLTEYANSLGLYQATITEALSGMYYFRVTTGGGAVVRTGWVYLEDIDTDIFRGANDYLAALQLYQMTFTNGRLHAALEDAADGISEPLFREVLLAFAVGPNTVTEIGPDERQVEFKNQGGTVKVTVNYDPADGQRVGTPTIVP